MCHGRHHVCIARNTVIHPTAIIDQEARLCSGVAVGAYSIIGPEVEIGDGTWIGPHVVLSGPTRIGRDNQIFQFASIGERPQHKAFRGEITRLEIGDRNVIREYVTLNRGSGAGTGVTRIGNDNFVMAYVHVAHDCEVGNHTILANAVTLGGHVVVGDHAVLGGLTAVHQFCRLGAHCMTAGKTMVFKDVPPYVMTSGYGAQPHGLNTRGLKRRQFSDESILTLRRAYKILYKSGLLLEEAIQRLEELGKTSPPVVDLVAFLRASERGIVR